MKQEITITPNQIELEKQFEYVNSIIEQHRSSAIAKVNTEVLLTNWEIGQYISMQLKSSAWGTKVVSDLADYLKRQHPKRRGYAKRNLYNMVKFYEMYSREDFVALTDTLNVNEFVQLPTAQVANATIKQNIPSLLVITTFTNHVEIMNRCRTDGNIQPQPSMVVEKITMPEGDIVMVEVQPAVFPPVRYKGRVWVRVGPRKAVANDADEHILLERRAANVQTFDSTPCFGASINDLDLQVFKHISGCILVERKWVY